MFFSSIYEIFFQIRLWLSGNWRGMKVTLVSPRNVYMDTPTSSVMLYYLLTETMHSLAHGIRPCVCGIWMLDSQRGGSKDTLRYIICVCCRSYIRPSFILWSHDFGALCEVEMQRSLLLGSRNFFTGHSRSQSVFPCILLFSLFFHFSFSNKFNMCVYSHFLYSQWPMLLIYQFLLALKIHLCRSITEPPFETTPLSDCILSEAELPLS